MDKYFQTSDGLNLRYTIKKNAKKTKWLFCVHGLGEHLGRHQYLVETFKKEYNIFQFDLRGHGKSDGARGIVNNFNEYIDDFYEILSFIIKQNSIKEYNIFAHSMGALITCGLLKSGKLKGKFNPKKVFLSSPPVNFTLFSKVFPFIPTKATRLMTKIPISFPIPSPNDYERYSHSKKTYNQLKRDPLVNNSTSSQLLFSIINASKEVFSGPINTKSELFLCIGSKDKIVCPRSAVRYFTDIMPISRILIIPGGFHELYNETDRYNKPFVDFLSNCI
ncbi:MAG: alpha/beta fold hydrolase [Bdellovibrionales bacterium]|nr:alpha/beta fold hydrolase [Bdellovibrionales bacterium]